MHVNIRTARHPVMYRYRTLVQKTWRYATAAHVSRPELKPETRVEGAGKGWKTVCGRHWWGGSQNVGPGKSRDGILVALST